MVVKLCVLHEIMLVNGCVAVEFLPEWPGTSTEALERLYRLGYDLTRAERELTCGEALAKGKNVAMALLETVRNRRAAAS